ncbi:hypothetical protein ABW19_dt0202261 [Dactylella cylindrospora]|nr:hypothetical protein ABW19_dt0202261 [Dactylella cylindrospora]
MSQRQVKCEDVPEDPPRTAPPENLPDAPPEATPEASSKSPPENKLTVIIVDPDQSETSYKVKFTTAFKKVVKNFEQIKSISPGEYRYIYEGVRVEPEKNFEENGITSEDLDDNGAIKIEAHREVIGGA